ncbi:hypothetical protein TrST_g13505 [Triparma strigata]|uniref:PDZ domain-containing protein n=1 Tax=Triparma strigata TaxID=1606541 RepID=A0A9W7E6G5_9STRA|nr:hypothetical protein TrST_g13505 [Triparma strigata]
MSFSLPPASPPKTVHDTGVSVSSCDYITGLSAEAVMELDKKRIVKVSSRIVYDLWITPEEPKSLPTSPVSDDIDLTNYSITNDSINSTSSRNSDTDTGLSLCSHSQQFISKMSSSLTLSISSSQSTTHQEVEDAPSSNEDEEDAPSSTCSLSVSSSQDVFSPLSSTNAYIPTLDRFNFTPTPEELSSEVGDNEEEAKDVRSRIISTLKNMHFIPNFPTQSASPPGTPVPHLQPYQNPPHTLTIALPPPPLLISFTCFETSESITVTDISQESKLFGVLDIGDVIVGLGSVSYDRRNVQDFVKAIQCQQVNNGNGQEQQLLMTIIRS